ncbi:MAG: hypothetical protein NW241_10320 [Bacteroidia bacterium]|nr:hypothetical protein [Bacteroidia bacterium]
MRIWCAGLLAVCCSAAQAQQTPRFAKYPVAETGCHVYLPADPGGFERSLSEDQSELYTAELNYGDHHFAVIVVRFSEPIEGGAEAYTALAESYLDFLQEQFGVTGSAGYGRGHTLESHPEASGVLDYWEDQDGLQYVVKAWCDSRFMAVLMLYGEAEYPYFNARELFLNGFRFPE